MSVSFGDFVRRAREQAGLTQSRLAQLIGKSPTTIRSWEHGRTNPADPGAVTAMAAVLGLDENDLLGQAGFEEAQPAHAPNARQELSSLISAQNRNFPLAVAPDVSVDTDVPVGTELPEHQPETDQIPVADTRIEAAVPAAVADTPIEAPAPAAIEGKVTDLPDPAPASPTAEPIAQKPVRDIPGPKTRIVVTQQSSAGTSVGSSNGYVGALSYVEDDTEKDFYRRRGSITAVVLIFMVVVIWWALGRTGGAVADLIEGMVGSLDI